MMLWPTIRPQAARLTEMEFKPTEEGLLVAEFEWQKGDKVTVYKERRARRVKHERLCDQNSYEVWSTRFRNTEKKGYLTEKQLKRHLAYVNERQKR
jgi:hypothetical protein